MTYFHIDNQSTNQRLVLRDTRRMRNCVLFSNKDGMMDCINIVEYKLYVINFSSSQQLTDVRVSKIFTHNYYSDLYAYQKIYADSAVYIFINRRHSSDRLIADFRKNLIF